MIYSVENMWLKKTLIQKAVFFLKSDMKTQDAIAAISQMLSANPTILYSDFNTALLHSIYNAILLGKQYSYFYFLLYLKSFKMMNIINHLGVSVASFGLFQRRKAALTKQLN